MTTSRPRGSSSPSSPPRYWAAARIGPNYKRPAVAKPETFRGQAAAEAVSFADAPWWEAFQDPTLKALIQEALRNNYDVAIAAARVQEARANLRVARSDLFPSLDYGARAGRAPAPARRPEPPRRHRPQDGRLLHPAP